MSKNRALLELAALSIRNASGELVATHTVDDTRFEVHVFLRQGRIAWATSSPAQNVLLIELTERVGIDRDALQEVIAECQRSGQSLGGTLVAWGLASLEDVSAALLRHMRAAIDPLVRFETCEWVFLERSAGYATYDARLTFGLEEVLPERNWRRHTPAIGLRPPLADRVRRSLPEARSVRVMNAETADPGVRLAARAGADFVAARAGEELVVGLQTELQQWIVVAAPQRLTLVHILQVLSETVRSPLSAPTATRLGVSERPAPPIDPRIAPLLDRFDELEGVAVMPNGPSRPRAGCRGSLLPHELLELARACDPILDAAAWHLPAESCSVILGRGGLWFFGTRVPRQYCTLWAVVKRSRPQALGWSMLAALARDELQVPSMAT